MVDEKPLRADARRNRARVLDAASAAFAEHGTGASTEQIARAAGVGPGTVFRHFPTKEDLLAAVYLARLEHLEAQARELASAREPTAALRGFFRGAVEGSSAKNALAEALAGAGVSPAEAASRIGGRLRAALGVLLERAQRDGGVRPDLTVTDVMSLLIGASRATEPLAADGPARERVVSVILDGLSPRH
ncbi:TetR/AcrR family transcriptional regulator [Catellatospora chokoriensis]|uniref:TetR family transcriptional regulator n=1 Tax=Catellatospora chokoriensis TaxID=310353 RepID=A0A8J3K986_9ACTN|nr:TetR/AcrR family transcriptional regulator [Catellatospora chokoriensis]GIF91789.1 TetR family transcriptional regulator [Catellatospora chokoriensis]